MCSTIQSKPLAPVSCVAPAVRPHPQKEDSTRKALPVSGGDAGNPSSLVGRVSCPVRPDGAGNPSHGNCDMTRKPARSRKGTRVPGPRREHGHGVANRPQVLPGGSKADLTGAVP